MTRVIATARGFHLGPREPGEVFEAPRGRDGDGRAVEIAHASWYRPCGDLAPPAQEPQREPPQPLSALRGRAGRTRGG